jgi:transcription initiation factor TFIIB
MDSFDEIWGLLDTLKEDPSTRTGSDSDPVAEGGVCPFCQGENLVQDDGQIVCMTCNGISSRVIDMGAEWRYYGVDDNRDEDPARCGLPTNDLLPKSSIGSIIGNKWGDSKDMRQIRMYQFWNSMPYWERTLYNVFDKIVNNTSNHGIPTKVLDDAKVLYKKASEKKISRGDNKEGLIASCIYFACLMNKIPRSPKEVARMFHIDPNVLTKGNARFQSLMQINVDCSNSNDYVARFGSRLNLNYDDIQKCKSLASKLDNLEIVSENSPTSVAAGTIYYFTTKMNIDISKKQISDVCEVSEVTIMKTRKRIKKYESLFESDTSTVATGERSGSGSGG